MRVFSSLMNRGRPIPQEPVPFKQILPLKLKDRVSGKGGSASQVCCLQEMSVMFSCFKENDFQQSMCGKEVKDFQKCYMSHLKETKQRTEREMKGILTPGERDLTPKQLNVLLRRYPNV